MEVEDVTTPSAGNDDVLSPQNDGLNSPSPSPMGGVSREASSYDEERNNYENPDEGENEDADGAGKNKSSPPKDDPNAWRPSLRFVIAATCGCVVLIVAIATLVTSNVVSNNTATDLGKRLSRSLATSAGVKAEDYFDRPVTHIDSAAMEVRAAGSLPSEDPNFSPDIYASSYRALLTSANLVYPTLGIFFADGTIMGTLPYLEFTPQLLCTGLRNRAKVVTDFTGINTVTCTYVATGTPVPTASIPPNISFYASNQSDSRSTTYYTLAYLTTLTPTQSVWTAPLAYTTANRGVTLTLGIGRALFNASNQFLGIVALAIPSERLTEFFKKIERPPSSEIICFDTANKIILGSTYTAPIYTSWFQAYTVPKPAGCLSSGDVVPSLEPGIVCPNTYSTYPYAPLQAYAKQDSPMLSVNNLTLEQTNLADVDYFVASLPLSSRAARFNLQIMFFLPQETVLGDIEDGRNLSIGISVAILVVAVLAAVGLVFLILKPLGAVLQQMEDTKNLNLKKSGEHQELSKIQEIAALQLAFAGMHSAVDSFAKYVPRDIVRDLMASGQVAKLGMTPAVCTMLFSDIAGFTSIAEHVPADELGPAMTEFFTTMSDHIMLQGGIVCKFIGDAIMAVWGAPLPVEHHEFKACIAALLMSRSTKMDPLGKAFDDLGEQLTLRIGLNSGKVLAGNLGSNHRLGFDVIGDSVNVASRCESISKKFGTRLTVTGAVFERVSSILATRRLMAIQVVGKEEPVDLFEVLGIKNNFKKAQEVIHTLDQGTLAGLDSSLRKDKSLTTEQSFGSIATGVSHMGSDAVSKRINSKVTSKICLERVMKITHDGLIVTDIEQKFADAFSECVLLCTNDALFDQCLQRLEQLEKEFAPFFSDDLHELRALVGENRSEASLIRAGLSAHVLRKQCQAGQVANVSFAGVSPSALTAGPSDFYATSPQAGRTDSDVSPGLVRGNSRVRGFSMKADEK